MALRGFCASSVRLLLLVGAARALAACDDDDEEELLETGPDVPFGEEITFDELREIATPGPTRLEIEADPDTLVARRVEIGGPEALDASEEVQGTITDIEVIDGEGFVTMELGGLRVLFDEGTTFIVDQNGGPVLFPDDHEVDGIADDDLFDDGILGDGVLEFEEFVDIVAASLAAGERPFVQARRPAPSPPQAPGDETFLADVLEVDLEDDAIADARSALALNVDADNLVPATTPPPDGFIRVLGLPIEVRDDITVIRIREGRVLDFDGLVASVDVDENTFRLRDGTVVEVVPATDIADDDDGLTTLATVRAAVDAGLRVSAEGEGILTGRGPRRLRALRVDFEGVEEVVADEVGDIL